MNNDHTLLNASGDAAIHFAVIPQDFLVSDFYNSSEKLKEMCIELKLIFRSDPWN